MKTWRSLINNNETIFFMLIQHYWPEFIELAKLGGFNTIGFDNEHGQYTDEQLLNLLRTAEACDMATIVRVSAIDPNEIKKVLDMGFHAIMIPDVSTVEDAKRVVKYCKYPPEGKRGACPFVRCNQYGTAGNDIYAEQNQELVIHVILEGIDAIENMEEIVKMEGIDVYCVGPWDLSVALGVPGQTSHPKVIEALERCNELCATYGKICNNGLRNIEDAAHYKGQPQARVFGSFKMPDLILVNEWKRDHEILKSALEL